LASIIGLLELTIIRLIRKITVILLDYHQAMLVSCNLKMASVRTGRDLSLQKPFLNYSNTIHSNTIKL